MAWPPKNDKTSAFSEEDVCVVSKKDTCIMWAGTKILYSGVFQSGNASGYNFLSGEVDVRNISASGWGEIRVPELNQLHKIFVFPKDPTILARSAYTALTLGTGSGYPDGHGGCSGKIALIHYMQTCSGCENRSGGGGGYWYSGEFNSGLVDIIAFGSEY